MLHTIQNTNLICTIESNGAQIRSLKNKTTGKEYIWQIDPAVWGHSSPVIFPSIGILKENKIVHNGVDYPMPKHGIIRGNDQLEFQKEANFKCSFSLRSSAETLKYYPFKFSFLVEYTLIKNQLIMTYKITNTDNTPMHFACGGHTAYSCPITEDIKLSDYVLEFPHELSLETNTILGSELLSFKKRKIPSDGKLLSLSENLFDNDFLIFPDLNCEWVRLRKKDEAKGTKVHFKDYPHLALWSKPGADFLCIEPWLGLPDFEDESTLLTQKRAHQIIQPNETFSIDIVTEVEDIS